MEKLYQEILLAMQEREQEISKLQEQNKEFLGYIECLEKKESFQNTGMDISQVKKKNCGHWKHFCPIIKWHYG